MNIWIKGPPDEPGIHWFKRSLPRKLSMKPILSVCQSRLYKGELGTYLFGDYGSGPISSYYQDSMFDQVEHALIDPPSPKWKTVRHVLGSTRMWVCDPEGYIGFGLFGRSWGDAICGSILWVGNDRQSASICGINIREGEGYTFSPVHIPNMKYLHGI